MEAVLGGAVGLGLGAWGSHQQSKAAKAARGDWYELYGPQFEFQREAFPLQLEMLREYVPYYKDVISTQKELLPLKKGMFTEQYLPNYQNLFSAIDEYAAGAVQPWEREAVSVPFSRARTRLGERAAGVNMLRSGAVQKLNTLYDIAEAEAMAKLPYQRREKAINLRMAATGYAPTTPAVGSPPTAKQQYIPQQPARYTGTAINPSQLGFLLGSMGIGAPASLPAAGEIALASPELPDMSLLSGYGSGTAIVPIY